MMEPLDSEIKMQREMLLNKLLEHKYRKELSFDSFCHKLKAKADKILLNKGIIDEFIIDEINTPIIYQLYLYFIGNHLCQWNIHAGIILAGKIGSGKTVLMRAYCELSNELLTKQISIYHANELVDYIKNNGIKLIEKKPIFIDELGREPTEIKDYGTIGKPIVELIARRYEIGARTYATTNYKVGALTSKYEEFIATRLLEMCNYILMPGESRRKNNLIGKF